MQGSGDDAWIMAAVDVNGRLFLFQDVDGILNLRNGRSRFDGGAEKKRCTACDAS
jgi:hypothetical protein